MPRHDAVCVLQQANAIGEPEQMPERRSRPVHATAPARGRTAVKVASPHWVGGQVFGSAYPMIIKVLLTGAAAVACQHVFVVATSSRTWLTVDADICRRAWPGWRAGTARSTTG